MPSVLVESGYLIRPDEEELLLNKEFQCLCSEAIAKGTAEFVRSFRKE
jgi:N-acetylmuramoyl-L-alanine amidase